MQGNNQIKKERQNDNSHSKTNIPNLGVLYLHTLTNKIIDFCTFHDTRVVQQRARWKKIDIDWLLSEILMIKDSCNLIGQETHLATPNHKWWPLKLPWRKLKYQLILSRGVDDQRILQSDWMRHATCNWPNPTKKVVPNSIFPWCKKKSRILINSSLIYWYLKNTASWMVLRILGHNCRTRFTPDMMLPENHKAYGYATILG